MPPRGGQSRARQAIRLGAKSCPPKAGLGGDITGRARAIWGMGPAGAMAPSGASGEKRASQEPWSKGLGHWDSPSIGRKRPIGGGFSLRGSPPTIAALAQEPLSLPPLRRSRPAWSEVARGWAVCRSWSPSATEIALPASVAAEPRVGSCGNERFAAGLADNLVMLDAATLPGTGVEHGAKAVGAAHPLCMVQTPVPMCRPPPPHRSSASLAAETLQPLDVE
jgi:hypothetical protein